MMKLMLHCIDVPVVQEYLLIDVNGLLVVSSEEMDGSQTQLIFNHILQILMMGHQPLLIAELKNNRM